MPERKSASGRSFRLKFMRLKRTSATGKSRIRSFKKKNTLITRLSYQSVPLRVNKKLSLRNFQFLTGMDLIRVFPDHLFVVFVYLFPADAVMRADLAQAVA